MKLVSQYLDIFFYDLKSKSIVKLSQKPSGFQINNGPVLTLEETKKIIVVKFPNFIGGRLGNKLFTVVNYILHCYSVFKDKYSECTYFFISLPNDLDIKEWGHLGFGYLENFDDFTYSTETEYSYPCFSTYSPIPLFYYLTDENEEPIIGLREYFDKITRDIRKTKYLDDKTTVSISFRASDFCSGKIPCFDKSEGRQSKNIEGMSAGFPILSISYYINCLDHLLRGKDYNIYRLVLFYYNTFIDSAILALYAEIFRKRYPGIEVLFEEEYLDYNPEGNEIDVIRAAGSSKIIISSNSTFSFHMVTYRVLNYDPSNIIYYPDGFIYTNTFFLDLSFTSPYMDKYKDYHLFHCTKERFIARLRAKEYNFVGIDSPYYVCYLQEIIIYKYKMLERTNTEYKTRFSKENPLYKHISDTVRLLLFFISICKLRKNFKINKYECDLKVFDLLDPYLKYSINGSEVEFIPDLARVENTEFNELIKENEIDSDFINKLIVFLEKLSFRRNTDIKYYNMMKFDTPATVETFFTKGIFDEKDSNTFIFDDIYAIS